MPCPEGRSVAILERVLRVPKVTSLAISACTFVGDILAMAAAICASDFAGGNGLPSTIPLALHPAAMPSPAAPTIFPAYIRSSPYDMENRNADVLRPSVDAAH